MEIISIAWRGYGNKPLITVEMDIKEFNEALANHIEHIQDQSFNEGFELGQDRTWVVKDDADMDADRAKDDQQA